MKYEQIRDYAEAKFRRITGVKRSTFEKIVEIPTQAHREKHRRRGRNPKLSIENRLLAALEYWREYRTYAHIAASYGISESSVFKTIRWIENVLVKEGTFSLLGKKVLTNSKTELKTILIDVTETPIERPKRGNENGILAKRNDIQ